MVCLSLTSPIVTFCLRASTPRIEKTTTPLYILVILLPSATITASLMKIILSRITSTQSAPVDIISERIVTGERNSTAHADACRVEDLRSGIAPHFRLRQARPVGAEEEADTVGGTLLRHAVHKQRRQYQVGKGRREVDGLADAFYACNEDLCDSLNALQPPLTSTRKTMIQAKNSDSTRCMRGVPISSKPSLISSTCQYLLCVRFLQLPSHRIMEILVGCVDWFGGVSLPVPLWHRGIVQSIPFGACDGAGAGLLCGESVACIS